MTSQKIGLVKDDPWLEPYEEDISQRLNHYKDERTKIEKAHGSLEKYASAYDYYGLN